MDILNGGKWHIHFGDCIPHMEIGMPESSVDLAVFSPPFPSLYAYTDSEADIGNVDDAGDESQLHLSFFYRRLCRVLKPGRVAMVHVMQIPRMKRSGQVGLCDFRGMNIRLGERSGLVYEYDWAVRKNPQALRNGSRVLTPRGWTAIESLVIGSVVIGSSGKPVRVAGVHPQGVRPLYRVKTSDGASVDCDGRHLWSVMTTRSVSAGTTTVLPTDEMRDRGLFMPSGEPRFYLPIMRGPAEFDGSTLPLDPYTLGALLGDGMLSSRGVVGICTTRGVADGLRFPFGHSLRMLPGSEKGNNVASWHIIGNEWHRNDVLDAVRDMGLDGCRAWEKFIPEKYLTADEESRRALMAGMLDTDGGNKVKGGIKYHTTSIRLAEGFRCLVESLGGICTLIRRAGGAYTLSSGEERIGRDIYELTPRLRDGVCPFRLRQKADAWKASTKGVRRAIVAIDAAGESPCTCITVDATDGLFVTEGCIVTHNSQAIRTKSRELQFGGLESDRAKSRGALPDYLIKFRKPGDNATPICDPSQVSRERWILWAESTWNDIRETRTLNTLEAKGERDTKHICPLQLDVIERLVRLYSDPDEVVFSPFAGVGSEGYVALNLGRRFYGCELKREYYETACRNLRKVESSTKSESLLFA